MMTEAQFRQAIADEAVTWIGTPYRSAGRVKGAGVNCAQFLFSVAMNSGVLASDAPEPKWYTPQLATHSREERLIYYILAYGAREISAEEIRTGDIVLYKSGLSHGHAALVLDWPTIIHVLPAFGCQKTDLNDGGLARYSKRFFTLWRGGAS